MNMTFFAIEQGYEGRCDMIRDTIEAVFGKPEQPTRMAPTRENILAAFKFAGGFGKAKR